jgi:hypothetical protein
MSSFKSDYLNKCKELNIEPSTSVIETLKQIQNNSPNSTHNNASKSSFYTLDISGQALDVKAITPLAYAFSQDVIFTKLILSDSFIGDDGKKMIFL